MIPVPGLESVRCNWVTIRGEGFSLHGFLLYTTSDHYFPEYMDGDGLVDLEHWTGRDFALFIVQSPSQQWIEYARLTDHTWWRLFGKQAEFFRQYDDTPVLSTDDGLKTLREVFAPCLNQIMHGKEIAKILHRFNLGPTQHPCMVLFKDLRDQSVWYIDCRDMLAVKKEHLRVSFQQWFDGSEFRKLMREARNA